MDYLERLQDNADFQKLLEVTREDRARQLERLAYLNQANYESLEAYRNDSERIKGLIHGLDLFLRAPDTAKQLLSQRGLTDE